MSQAWPHSSFIQPAGHYTTHICQMSRRRAPGDQSSRRAGPCTVPTVSQCPTGHRKRPPPPPPSSAPYTRFTRFAIVHLINVRSQA